jgi:cytochrome c-type biogenesis protein
MAELADLNILLAFGAGFLSFISPCCLPLYPAFLSYITGVSVGELKEEHAFLQKRALLHTLFFLLGFTIIFLVLGFSTTLIGELFVKYQGFLQKIGAILMVFFGFVIIGFIKPSFLMKDKKYTFKSRPTGYIGSLLIGLGFAAGWTPCTGPILVAVMSLSLTNPEAGLLYMGAYSLGFAVPFFILAFFIGKLNWIKKHSLKIMKIGGYTMIVMGIFLYFNWLSKLTSFLITNFFNGFQGF